MKLKLTGVFALLLCAAGSVQAEATCSVSASGLSFGEYDVLSLHENHSVGNLSVSCTGLSETASVAYEIQLSRGSGAYGTRTLTSGDNVLAYNVYTQANHLFIWGDGSLGTAVLNDSYGLGLSTVSNNYPVYGRMPAGQSVSAGNYSDTLIMTIIY